MKTGLYLLFFVLVGIPLLLLGISLAIAYPWVGLVALILIVALSVGN